MKNPASFKEKSCIFQGKYYLPLKRRIGVFLAKSNQIYTFHKRHFWEKTAQSEDSFVVTMISWITKSFRQDKKNPGLLEGNSYALQGRTPQYPMTRLAFQEKNLLFQGNICFFQIFFRKDNLIFKKTTFNGLRGEGGLDFS